MGEKCRECKWIGVRPVFVDDCRECAQKLRARIDSGVKGWYQKAIPNYTDSVTLHSEPKLNSKTEKVYPVLILTDERSRGIVDAYERLKAENAALRDELEKEREYMDRLTDAKMDAEKNWVELEKELAASNAECERLKSYENAVIKLKKYHSGDSDRKTMLQIMQLIDSLEVERSR